MDFTNEMDAAARSVSRDSEADGSGFSRRKQFPSGATDFLLNPPLEAQAVIFGVTAPGGIHLQGRAGLCFEGQRLESSLAVDVHLRVGISPALFSPLHAGAEIIELVGVKAQLVTFGDGAFRLLPARPGNGERIGADALAVVAGPTCLPIRRRLNLGQ